jgi:outer membrane protein TolC
MRMRRRRGAARGTALVALIIALLLSAIALPAQETITGPLTLELAAELAVATNNQIVVLQRKLQDQVDDLGFAGFLDDISLKLSGSAGGDAEAALSASGTAILSAGIDIIPQLTLTGNITATGATAEPQGGVSDPLSGSLGLTFNPLADPNGRDRDELAAESTAIDLADATGSAAYGAIGSLIDALLAQMELELLVVQQELAIRALTNTQALYDRNRATDQQLESAEDAVRSGAQRLVRAELAAERAKEVVARDTGIPAAALTIPPAAAVDLDSYVDDAAELAVSLSAVELAESDPALSRADLEVRSARLDLEATHKFTPKVSISATGGLPDWRYSLGAELTVSPADWDGTAVDDAGSDLASAERDYDYALRIAEYDAIAALNNLAFSLDDLEVAAATLADAGQDLTEATFRFGRGDLTQLSLDQTEQGVTEAEYEVTSAKLGVVRDFMAIEYGQY